MRLVLAFVLSYALALGGLLSNAAHAARAGESALCLGGKPAQPVPQGSKHDVGCMLACAAPVLQLAADEGAPAFAVPAFASFPSLPLPQGYEDYPALAFIGWLGTRAPRPPPALF